MGLKRVSFVAEATFLADDTRELETLMSVTSQATSDGLIQNGGTLARIGITGAAVDPDPEMPAEDVVPKPPVIEVP